MAEHLPSPGCREIDDTASPLRPATRQPRSAMPGLGSRGGDDGKELYQAVALQRLEVLTEQAIKDFEGLLGLARIKRAAGQVADLDVVEAAANVADAKTRWRIPGAC